MSMKITDWDADVLEDVMMMYDAERFSYMTPYSEVRDKINGDACHDLAIRLGVDANELADYIASVSDHKPDPRTEED